MGGRRWRRGGGGGGVSPKFSEHFVILLLIFANLRKIYDFANIQWEGVWVWEGVCVCGGWGVSARKCSTTSKGEGGVSPEFFTTCKGGVCEPEISGIFVIYY